MVEAVVAISSISSIFLFLILLWGLSGAMKTQAHSQYWFDRGDNNGCGKMEWHADASNNKMVIRSDFTCGSWQKSEASSIFYGSDGKHLLFYARCYCDITCLKTPTNPNYNDDPAPKNHNNNAQKITLPVVLSWNNIPGWKI